MSKTFQDTLGKGLIKGSIIAFVLVFSPMMFTEESTYHNSYPPTIHMEWADMPDSEGH